MRSLLRVKSQGKVIEQTSLVRRGKEKVLVLLLLNLELVTI
jgi:hypothetical protein